ncbi:MAG TPA: glycosyltransferase [Candidatus Bacteroides merdigallinarum]|uniref:Glycosyltransferase n=1 Tax=Candidatus Bacteroides merdigallinarum TaxID=2838473 RepID=A0A9D2EB64_9BACE|nr:glycosyltransferase [Candidatus Bacteroides merdigallinarum]
MRILQLGKFYPILGGIEKVMFDIVEGVSKFADIKSDMLCAFDGKTNRIICIYNSKIFCTSTWFKFYATMISPTMIVKLRRICRNYDIIHIHHPDPMAALALRLSGYKGKVILHWHSDILKQKKLLKFYEPLQSWLINRADVIVGTSPKYLQCSPFLQKASLHKICIPIGIDPIICNKEAVDSLKDKYPNKKLIFSLGRLVEYKGYKYLIEAAKYLSDQYVILIGGSGPLKEELESVIQQNGLNNKVRLLGRIPDAELSVYYGACDVYVLSSIWKTEAFGIVQIEAMSCGKPVVATKIDGSGVDWVNEDGVSGINVPTEDAKSIADAIIYLTSDENRYRQFSQGALKRYENLFRKELMIKRCLTLYNSLVNKR